MMTRIDFVLAMTLWFSLVNADSAPNRDPVTGPADRVYRNGKIFTADQHARLASVMAIRGGQIVYVGPQKGVESFVGPNTEEVDLHGRFLMPGLIDGHMHPIHAGRTLLKFDLNYESLTIADLQARIQSYLDRSEASEPDGWLEAVNWFQESMRPPGTKTSHMILDGLRTRRPILIRSSFQHTVLVNSRAMEIAGITSQTIDPSAGKIWRDELGKPTGLFEDSAIAVFDALLPKPTPEEDVAAAAAALEAMNRQGVTSFLDAAASRRAIATFSALRRSGKLTARAHFAPVIEPKEAADPNAAVLRIAALARSHDEGPLTSQPSISVRHAKLFLDGVISAPSFTGAMLQPYWTNSGTATKPKWKPGTNCGPAVYFQPESLAAILVELGRSGIHPHMHADGDAAVRAGLDAIAVLRRALPGVDIRPSIAHDEMVDPQDFPRFRQLNATAVLSFQWEKPAGDTLGCRDHLGARRARIMEPAGLLARAGARIAFGSDWPVDPLDQWFAFRVGVTRRNRPDSPAEFRGRLGKDAGLSREAVLLAATLHAAYELQMDDVAGTLEAGKLADFIILDRDPLKVPVDDIAKVRVLQTVIGGSVVYQASSGNAPTDDKKDRRK